MRPRAAWAAPALVAALAFPSAARAFSNPALFAAPAEQGGGAGRHFTGSPADGLGCGVCHRGGAPPRIFVEGLPEALEPAARYDVTLRWELPQISHAMHVELLTAGGEHPGVELSNAAALPPEERCEGDPDGPPAVYAADLGARRVLGVQDCGASALTFSFVAPAEPLYFAIGAVRSDSSATPEGDGVLEHRGVLSPAGAPAEGGACAVQAPLGGGSLWHVAPCVSLLWLAVRRRSRSVRERRSE